MYIFIALLINVACSLSLLYSDKFASRLRFRISDTPIINTFAQRQLIGLVTALIAMLITIVLKGSEILAIGNLLKYPIALDWMGITADKSWLTTGLELCFSITLITIIFLLHVLWKSRPLSRFQVNWVVWIIIFSATNALIEEIIYRFTTITLLHGMVAPLVLYGLSGVFFGIPHLRGMPNGTVGMIMASILGFVLAKSVQETGGIAIAWCIHFLQDLPIMTTIIWISAKPSSKNASVLLETP